MELKSTLRSALALTLCAVLTACASGRGHQNFKNIMQLEVGKSADAPYAYRNHYRERRIASRTLPNGNIEEEYRSGRGPHCRVYFEIDEAAGKIVNWRYEGTEQDCVIVP